MNYASEAPGLFAVRYETPQDLEPDQQRPLIRDIELASAKGPVGIVFQVGPSVTSVTLAVPSFWIEVTGRKELRIAAMAIVTRALSVRMAARGFALSNRIRGISTQIETFEALEPALQWARSLLDAAPQAPIASGRSGT